MHTSLSMRIRRLTAGLALAVLFLALPAFGQQKTIQLPKPQITGGMPLMEALAKRQTTREFADKPLPLQTLSNLLWAAFGINRPKTAMGGLGRTAPSAMNLQEIEIDVVLADGVYVYEVEKNQLRPTVSGDVRGKIGTGAVDHAAVTLVYVANANHGAAEVDTGLIGQNVYLFAASEGLNAWLYAFHTPDVAAILKLQAGRKPFYGESVGYPVK
jgi:nitroreductase